MKGKSRTLALLLAIMMLAVSLLTACGGSKGGEEKEAGADGAAAEKQLVVEVGPNPETVDPALNSSVDGANMILHAFEGLLIVNEQSELAPGQAESWEMSEDGLTWTFKLKPDLKWSDGSPLTANDFVYTYKRVADPVTAAPYAETVLGTVKGFKEAQEGNLDALAVSAPDELTFVVELSSPTTYFGDLAAFGTLMPVQEKTITENGEAWATKPESYISNGPFKMTEFVANSHITMVKNENYWNADAIKLDSIKWLLIEDPNAAYSAYQNGEAHMIKSVPTEEIPSLADNPEYHVAPIIGTYYISFNTQKAPLDNANVRKALSLAIDRDFVANTLMQGTYTPAGNFIGEGWVDPTGGFFAEKANGGKPYIDFNNHAANLEQAKQLLADAGYPNGEGLPAMTYTTNDAGYHKAVAEYLQEAWKELGVTLSVEVVEWSSFTPMRRAGEYEIARNGWVGDYNDASNMLDLLYTTNGNNDGKFSNVAFDEQMDIARSTADNEVRSEALHKAEDIIFEEAAMTPVAYYNDFYLQSEKVTGSWHSPYGYWYFMYADIAE